MRALSRAVESTSLSRFRPPSARPDAGLTVRIQSVVRRKLLRHVVVVILRDRLEPRGNGVEAGGLRRELAGIGVSAAYDERQGLKRGVVQLVLVEEGVERAVVAVVAKSPFRAPPPA